MPKIVESIQAQRIRVKLSIADKRPEGKKSRKCKKSGAAVHPFSIDDPNYLHKFIALLHKDYYLIPGNGAKNLFMDQIIYTNLRHCYQRTIS